MKVGYDINRFLNQNYSCAYLVVHGTEDNGPYFPPRPLCCVSSNKVLQESGPFSSI